MSNLLTRMKGAGSIKNTSILSDSIYFNKKDVIPTELPILNIAFSGNLDGGMVSGLTVFAGASKTFKTMLGLYCIKAYFNKYPDSICLFYDSEFGTPPDYLKMFNIDTDRILHIPIEHVEQLKFDMVKRLEEIKRGDRVFIFVDSLGSLASKKEIEDAVDEKSVSDMTRAKSIRSFLRIITPHLTMKDLPCVIINHVYSTMELYSKTVIPGGTAVTYSSNQIFVITKAQEKDSDGDLSGHNFTINIEKSRFVREKSKLPISVSFNNGIEKYSGLLDVALEGGFVVKPQVGWYSKVDSETGEVMPDKYRKADTMTTEFWGDILVNEKFNEFVKAKYEIGHSSILAENTVLEETEEVS